MKTLADLKRDARSEKLSGEMVYRYGDEIPEKLKGKRKIIDANSVAIFFLNNDGRKSELHLESASLTEYDGDTLTIYIAGLRDLNEEEKKVMDEWKKITDTKEYRDQATTDLLTDGSSTYWNEKSFFENRDMLYLMGCETIRGQRLDFNTNKIRDNKVKGDKILQYKIYKEN